MRTLVNLLTAIFLFGSSVHATNTVVNNFARGYGNSFIFVEGGIEFSVFPDGQFDFFMQNHGPNVNVAVNTPGVSISFNSGFDYTPFVQFDDFGAIIQIQNTPVFYDFYGRVAQIGNVNIRYNNFGRVARVGGLFVHYNRNRVFTHYTGFINPFNRFYVWQPWHRFYVIPPVNFGVVCTRPYRQFYTPIRHTWYRPYYNNVRRPVVVNGRRGANVATTGRRGNSINTRYIQESNNRREVTRSRSNATRGTQRTLTNRSATRSNSFNTSTNRDDRRTNVRNSSTSRQNNRSFTSNTRVTKRNAVVSNNRNNSKVSRNNSARVQRPKSTIRPKVTSNSRSNRTPNATKSNRSQRSSFNRTNSRSGQRSSGLNRSSRTTRTR